jgi:hypothetical protein
MHGTGRDFSLASGPRAKVREPVTQRPVCAQRRSYGTLTACQLRSLVWEKAETVGAAKALRIFDTSMRVRSRDLLEGT